MDTVNGRLEPPNLKMEEDCADDTTAPSSESITAAGTPAGKQLRNSRKRTKTGCLTCRKRRIKCGEERPRCSNCVKSKRNCEGYNQRVIFKDPIHGYRPQVGQAAVTVASFQRPAGTREAQAALLTHLDADGGPQLPLIAPKPYNIQHTTEISPLGTQGQSTPGSYVDSGPCGLSLSVQPAVSQKDIFPTVSGAPGLENIVPHQSYAHAPLSVSHSYGTGLHSSVFDHQQAMVSSDSLQQDNQNRSFDPKLLNHYPRDVRSSGDGGIPNDLVIDAQPWIHSTEQQAPRFVGGRDFDDQIASEDEECSDDIHDVQDEEMEDEAHGPSPEYGISAKGGIATRLGPLLPLHPRFDDSSMRTFRTLLNEPNMLATYQPSLSTSPLTDPRTARIFAHFVSATGPSLSIFERHPTNPSVIFTEGPVSKARQSLWTYTIPMLALNHIALMQAILAISSLHIAKLQGGSTMSSLKHYHVSIVRLKKCVGLPSRRLGIGTLAATLLLGYYEVIAGEHSKWNSHLLGAKQLLQETDFAGMTGWLKFMKEQEVSFSRGETYPAGSTPLGFSYTGYKPPPRQNLEAESGINEHLISKLMGRSVPSDNSGRVAGEKIGAGYADYRQKTYTVKELEDFQVRQDLFWWYCKQDVFQSILSGNRLLMEYHRWGECLPRAAIGRLDAVYGTADHLWLLLGRLADFNARDLKRKKKAVDANGGQWRPQPLGGGGPQGGVSYTSGRTEGQWAGAGSEPVAGIRGGLHAGTHDGMFNTTKERRPGGMAAERPIGMGGRGHDRIAQGHAGAANETDQLNTTRVSGATFGRVAGGSFGGASSDERFIPPAHPGSLPPGPLNGMHGMIPPTAAARMPEGFIDSPFSLATSEGGGLSLEAATIEATREWEDIKQALQLFKDSLGPDYESLSSEYQQPLATPFGPTLYYRTYSIACIWACYYTALILHQRTHPLMPPAAMMAAGVAAQQTAKYANEIGRICAGLIPSNHSGQVSPALGGAIAECVMPLFFAGVQYQDAGQRVYTVSKLREVSRMTGWQTAAAVAAGCESAWVSQAELGRGPPYARTRDVWAKDERVSGNRPGPDDPVLDSNSDRRFIQVNANSRVHWAIGIIGVEEDMENLSV
ncbi:MAG: hypothetical protein M1839_007493 [Geoglossum umbratile]|nr:MAG: hypothetical protein M1839_007493 [Geoglossum umbratile]